MTIELETTNKRASTSGRKGPKQRGQSAQKDKAHHGDKQNSPSKIGYLTSRDKHSSTRQSVKNEEKCEGERGRNDERHVDLVPMGTTNIDISWSGLHPSVKRALHALTPQELQMSDGDPNSPFTKLMRKLLTERDSEEFARKRLKYSKAQCKPTPKPARKYDDDSEDDRQDNLRNDSQRSYYAQQSRSSKDTPNGSQMTNRGKTNTQDTPKSVK